MKLLIILGLCIFLIGCDCSNPNVGQCEEISKIKNFEVDMAGTGIGAGAQLHYMVEIDLENGQNIVKTYHDRMPDIYIGQKYSRCGACSQGYYERLE